MNTTTFEMILNDLELGELTSPIISISGGFMHKMYCMETTTGKYAIKLLNPEIMKRPDVFENYQTAEMFERILQLNNLPIAPALTFHNRKMQCINKQYYYIFDWIDGKALNSEEIEKSHCQIAGKLLAKIHRIEKSDKPLVRNEICIDWDYYITSAYKNCPEISDILIDNRNLLYTSQNEGNIALKNIPSVTTICNGDMDSKNVLWVNGEPIIIDLECLNYGNPYMELFQLALSWSGFEHCHLDYTLLKSFITAYCMEYGKIEVDWEILYSSNLGRLEWLEYNIKRALMIECADAEEQRLGIEQVKETINHVIYYSSIKKELLENLNAMYQ
jgi:thiamine kinase-like enzyme